jgi:hypothetical protein
MKHVERSGGDMDRTRAGRRCRTIRFVRTVAGDLRRESQGTIRHEVDNLERHLVFVEWDQGFTVPVFLDEIEEIDSHELHA